MLVVVAASVLFLGSSWHRIYLPTATGITAKQVCSLHFNSGLTPDRARALYIDPLLAPFDRFVSSRVDAGRREVNARLLGLYHQRAVFRDGLGCSLVHDGSGFDRTLALPDSATDLSMDLDVAHRDARFDSESIERRCRAAPTT